MILALALLIAPVPAPADDPPPAAVTARALVEAHNRERAGQGRPPLVAEPRLTEAARKHAADMASHKNMSHEGSDGSTPADRVKREGYPYVSTGENVAKGQATVEAVMTAWMDSPHHRDNILGDFGEIGVAKAEADDGAPYWCAVFGRPIPRLDPARAEAEAEVAQGLNRAREQAGKAALKVDPPHASAPPQIAADHAAKVAPVAGGEAPPKAEGPGPFDRVKASGYRFATIAQSGSAGAPTPESVLKLILGADDQKATMLGDYADLGVGYAQAGDGRPSWCLLLARPLP